MKIVHLKKPQRLKKIFFSLIFLLFALSAFTQQHTYWQQEVNYRITVSLNDTNKTLDGFLTLDYINHSPDTLRFIWFHIWPNAYKNDQTAFSEQLLKLGRTDFYFSEEQSKGYLNRLHFTVDEITAQTADHPLHQDIIKLLLPSPLAPGKSCNIETPFHVKLPYNFSRGGYIDSSFQITQWYPKPAVYDQQGWHEMPYLDQGEFYSEFGNYDVTIHVPQKYIVAATGVLISDSIEAENKQLRYQQNNIHDFAWFADQHFLVDHDTLQTDNRTIDVFFYHYNGALHNKVKATNYIKNALRSKNEWLGTYPYATATVVEHQQTGNGGMEYPTITLIDKTNDSTELESIVYHEIGHNWMFGILASNERQHPWLDEGINSYYDKRYKALKHKNGSFKGQRLTQKLPTDFENTLTNAMISIHKDQPIATSSEDFSAINYALIGYNKAANWVQLLADTMGISAFDSGMQAYYNQWKFKHPQPEDFLKIMQAASEKNLSNLFGLLEKKGSLQTNKQTKKINPALFFNFRDDKNQHNISFLPAFGYNIYDKLMPGITLHNYDFIAKPFQFFTTAFWGIHSKKLNALARLSYTVQQENKGKLIFSLSAARFSNNLFTDSIQQQHFFTFQKLTPSIKYFFHQEPQSQIQQYIQWKTYFINETTLQFYRDPIEQKDYISYPTKQRYLNQLQFDFRNDRVLYPYHFNASIEQADYWMKMGVTGDYFFNYSKGGGLSVRAFAGKFLYTQNNSTLTTFETERYHLNMSGANGFEDYTYSNYFVGRNEFEGFSNQQMMMKDGAFKIRTDLLSSKIGKSDKWLCAVNFTSTIPDKINPLSILPVKIPLKLFADLGTYGEAWGINPPTEKLLYNAGLQLSLLNNLLNIYLPLVYSKSFTTYVQSTLTEKTFLRKISFSIDIQKFRWQSLPAIGQIPY